ncbi:MAG: hypothetical protein WBD23_07435 [Candidatus Acidiferrales bacterium]
MTKCGAAVAALLLIAGFWGCAMAPDSGNGADPPGGSPAGNVQAHAAISLCNSTDSGCSPATNFSISSLRDLNISIDWSNLPAGNHAQILQIVHPGGGLYQTMRKSFLVDESANGAYSTTDALPVAGTWITERSLTGVWQIQVELDGNVITTSNVTLTP